MLGTPCIETVLVCRVTILLPIWSFSIRIYKYSFGHSIWQRVSSVLCEQMNINSFITCSSSIEGGRARKHYANV